MVFVIILLLASLMAGCARDERQHRMSGAGSPDLWVGAAAANFEADDSMILGGMIDGVKASGQEGPLRAVAIVLAKSPREKLAIVGCDVLMLTRDLLDPVMAEIERTTAFPGHTSLSTPPIRITRRARSRSMGTVAMKNSVRSFSGAL